MFIFRFIIFDLQESSKYLIAKRRDAEAIKVLFSLSLILLSAKFSPPFSTPQVLQHIAQRNGKTISLTLDHLSQINPSREVLVPRTTWQLLKSSFSTLSLYVLLQVIHPPVSEITLFQSTRPPALFWEALGNQQHYYDPLMGYVTFPPPPGFKNNHRKSMIFVHNRAHWSCIPAFQRILTSLPQEPSLERFKCQRRL